MGLTPYSSHDGGDLQQRKTRLFDLGTAYPDDEVAVLSIWNDDLEDRYRLTVDLLVTYQWNRFRVAKLMECSTATIDTYVKKAAEAVPGPGAAQAKLARLHYLVAAGSSRNVPNVPVLEVWLTIPR